MKAKEDYVMGNDEVVELINFVNKLADTSGEIIQKYYRSLDEIKVKNDLSPVTIADIEVEKALRKIIQEEYPCLLYTSDAADES